MTHEPLLYSPWTGHPHLGPWSPEVPPSHLLSILHSVNMAPQDFPMVGLQRKNQEIAESSFSNCPSKSDILESDVISDIIVAKDIQDEKPAVDIIQETNKTVFKRRAAAWDDDGVEEAVDPAALRLLRGPYVWGYTFTLREDLLQVLVHNLTKTHTLTLNKHKVCCTTRTSIWAKCEAVLGEFLQGIQRSPTRVDYSGMINILISHSQSPDDVIQYTAITWIKEFVLLSGRTMLPFASGIITAVLPCLAYDTDSRKNTREAARAVNTGLMRLVGAEDDQDLSPPPASKGDQKSEITSSTTETSEEQESGTTDLNTNSAIQLDISSMVEVLSRQLLHESMQTRIAALRWIYHLHIKTPNKIFRHVDELFPLLLKALSDPSDEVVLLDLEVLAEVSSSSAGQNGVSPQAGVTLPSPVKKAVESSHSMNAYFTKFMVSLLDLFSTDRQLLEDRGAFIIRQLCLLLRSEDIYQCCSQILIHEEDLKFAAHMIQTLNTILLTSTELFDLRSQLKDLKTEESCQLFICLYKSWCHDPVSTVALCYLSQNYEHACNLLTVFGDLEVNVEFLTEIDKLVQLLESPIFTYLRLQLLDINHNHHLIKSLYGLLMLLPQSDAFRTLRHRLECVPHLHILPPEERTPRNSVLRVRPAVAKINFTELQEAFVSLQQKHRKAGKKPRGTSTEER